MKIENKILEDYFNYLIFDKKRSSYTIAEMN